MAKSKATFNKIEKEKKRFKKRQDKEAKREERKSSAKGGGWESMLAYVDEFGNITDTPPDPSKKEKVEAENIEIGIPRRQEGDEIPAEHKGKVSYYDDSKGYGFIIEHQTNEKYFVHVSALTEPITQNDTVTFELERGLKGMNAVKVKKV